VQDSVSQVRMKTSHRRGAAHLLNVDIEVFLLLAVPGEHHLVAIGRETGVQFRAWIGREADDG
jgi:hypothetical protein